MANTHTKFDYNRFSRSEDTSDPRGGVKPEIRRRRRRRQNARRAVRSWRVGGSAPVEGRRVSKADGRARRVGPRPSRADGRARLAGPRPSRALDGYHSVFHL